MQLELMRVGLYTSWLLPLALPFLVAALLKQAWRSRIAFVLIGVLIVLGVRSQFRLEWLRSHAAL